MKPVISPLPTGAKKVGMVRNQEDQLKMALKKLTAMLKNNSAALVMLEYSDNKNWVEKTVKNTITGHYPDVEIIVQPLSLTSGAHMGPGTWGIAFMPDSTAP
jgi:fatty acid-binding protein DegV